MCEGGGTVQNTLKGSGTEKRGGETKISKRGSKLGQGVGALKGGGGSWNPLTNPLMVSTTHNEENFNLRILYDHICWCSLKIQSQSLKFNFRTGRSSPYNFHFVSLVLSKPEEICIKDC